jgi:hypothetical protein
MVSLFLLFKNPCPCALELSPRLSPGLPTCQVALILGAQNSKSLFLNALSVIPIGVPIRESIVCTGLHWLALVRTGL